MFSEEAISKTNKEKPRRKRHLLLRDKKVSFLPGFLKHHSPFCEPLGSFSSFCASSILSGRQEGTEERWLGAERRAREPSHTLQLDEAAAPKQLFFHRSERSWACTRKNISLQARTLEQPRISLPAGLDIFTVPGYKVESRNFLFCLQEHPPCPATHWGGGLVFLQKRRRNPSPP